jgi:predicted metal-dependent hydrolase
MLQLALEFFRPSPTRPAAQPTVFTWNHGLVVHVVRPARARRYLLRLNRDGTVRLAIPRRGSYAEALRFLARSEAWLLRARARWRPPMAALPWQHGTRFLFRGRETALEITGAQLAFADQRLALPAPLADYRPLVEAHLRRLAEKELPPRVAELAGAHDIRVNRVTIRAQRSRWGSCSARGTISLNWRLIQAPAGVVDYLILHELMHRREMNHSTRFWRHVAHACPAWREAEAWLKSHPIENL